MADKKKGVLRDKYSRQPSSSQHYAEVTLESEDGNGAHHIDLGDIVQGVSSSVEQQSLLPNSTSINMPPRDDDNNNDSPPAHLDTAQIKALTDKLKALLETLEAVAHPPQPAAPEPEKKYVLQLLLLFRLRVVATHTQHRQEEALVSDSQQSARHHHRVAGQ